MPPSTPQSSTENPADHAPQPLTANASHPAAMGLRRALAALTRPGLRDCHHDVLPSRGVGCRRGRAGGHEISWRRHARRAAASSACPGSGIGPAVCTAGTDCPTPLERDLTDDLAHNGQIVQFPEAERVLATWRVFGSIRLKQMAVRVIFFLPPMLCSVAVSWLGAVGKRLHDLH